MNTDNEDNKTETEAGPSHMRNTAIERATTNAINEKASIDPDDDAWVQNELERMLQRTPAAVVKTFNAEHEATDHVTFDQFWKKRYQAERKKWREKENQEVLRLAIEKEVVELFGEIYFAYVGGTRLAKVKRLSDILICPKCGTPIPGHAESSLHECYDARHRSLGDPGETFRLLPFKVDASGSCPKCNESWSATFLVIP